MIDEAKVYILTVTQRPGNSRQLRQLLESKGYNVLAVTSLDGLDGVLASTVALGLALIDITGFDERIWSRCEVLRAAGVPLFVVTGRAGVAVSQAGAAHGAEGVLVKPLIVNDLLTLVRGIMEA